MKDVHLKVERTGMERKPVSHYRVSVEMQGTGSMGESVSFQKSKSSLRQLQTSQRPMTENMMEQGP